MRIDNEKGVPQGAEEFKAPDDKSTRKLNVIEYMEDMDREDAGLPPVDRSAPRPQRTENIIDQIAKADNE